MSGRSKLVLCPECSRPIRGRGLAAHRRIAHKVTPATRLDRTIELDRARAAALAEESESITKRLVAVTDGLSQVAGLMDAFDALRSRAEGLLRQNAYGGGASTAIETSPERAATSLSSRRPVAERTTTATFVAAGPPESPGDPGWPEAPFVRRMVYR